MLVLSSTNLTIETRNKLTEKYPSLDFVFYRKMEDAKEKVQEAEILLTYGEDLTPDLIQKAAKLKWIMVLSAGMDEMPFEEIKQRNIMVTNSRGIHKIPMAEYAISMIMQVYRQTNTLIQNQKNHYWDRKVPVNEISGKTMTIVGAGAIGQEVARLANAFRIKTIGVSHSGIAKEYFDEMYSANDINKTLPQADFIVSVLPSTKETADFFTYGQFKLMRNTAIFLNMGRGNAVRSETIIKALENEEIAHVVLDVYEEEPLSSNHPLWDNPKVTMTPHLSGKSPNYIPRAIEIFEQNLEKYLNGEKTFVNQIDLDRGY